MAILDRCPGMAQMASVLKLQLVMSLKRSELDFHFEVAKMSNELKTALKDCDIGAYRKVGK